MYQKEKMIGYGALCLTGICVFLWAVVTGNHAYWSAVGCGLAAGGGNRLLMGLRYHRDAEFARETDVETQDERNKFLMEKSQAGGFTASIATLGLASMAAYALGHEDTAILLSMILCGMLLLECVIYWIVKKKY